MNSNQSIRDQLIGDDESVGSLTHTQNKMLECISYITACIGTVGVGRLSHEVLYLQTRFGSPLASARQQSGVARAAAAGP